ncbi:MAG: Multi-copper polyphenol oxidoreductase laccase [Candidatus Parcubacteria bacterium]|jgi:copper oxidase (laccase) domain-containing protein
MLSQFLDVSPSYVRSCAQGRVEISVFGKPHNFRGLSQNTELLQSLVHHAHEHHIASLCLPMVSLFNACVAEGLSQFRKSRTVLETKVFEECFVDGVRISKGEAFFVASADCPTLVFSSPNKKYVVACHAGLKSLVDYNRIYHEGRIRTHQSVVDRALEFFRGDELNVSIGVVCGIGAHAVEYSTTDKKYGTRNSMLVEYVFGQWGGDCFAPYIDKTRGDVSDNPKLVRPSSLSQCLGGHIDLFALVRAQAEKRNVPRGQVLTDGICTYTTGSGSHGGKFHSHRRQMQDGVKPEEGKRNGVLVMMKG